jgi:hypothetical protein
MNSENERRQIYTYLSIIITVNYAMLQTFITTLYKAYGEVSTCYTVFDNIFALHLFVIWLL